VEGRLETALQVSDAVTGADATVPAGACIYTTDSRYDQDGDGLADRLRLSLSRIPPGAAACSAGTLDGGVSTHALKIVGGVQVTPPGAQLDQDAELLLPLHAAAGLGNDRVLWVWLYAEVAREPAVNQTAAAASATGGSPVWLYDGLAGTQLAGTHVVAAYRTRRLGSFALSLPLSSNSPPSVYCVTANPGIVEPGAAAKLACHAVDAEGDALNFAWSGTGAFTAPSASETEWSAPDEGRFELACTVRDALGRAVARSVIVTVKRNPPDRPPVITQIRAQPTTVQPGETVQLDCQADDPEGEPLEYTWTGPGVFDDAHAAETAWRHDAPGTYALSCTVLDAHGNAASAAVTVTVAPLPVNAPPGIQSVAADPPAIVINEKTHLACAATDPDGDPLMYAWSGAGQFATPDQSATTWTHDVPGAFVLTCNVDDGQGHVVAGQVQVAVLPRPNQPPVIDSIRAEPASAPAKTLIGLRCIASDSDGDMLSYSWSGPGLFATPGSAVTTWLHDQEGAFTLTCTVDDGHGHQVGRDVTVTLTYALDTTPPAWPPGGPQFTVQPFEGYVLLQWAGATDTESPPVVYSIYYAMDTGLPLNPGTAARLDFTGLPVMPVRIDGLLLGQRYQFWLIAADSAPQPNATTVIAQTATPQPYYDVAPPGDVSFSETARCASFASLQTEQAILCVVWADPATGRLREAHSSDGKWVVRDVDTQGVPARHYVIPEVCFSGGKPAVVAADDAGHLDLLRQRVDGKWDGIQVYSGSDPHAALSIVLDEVLPRLYAAHVTSTGGTPATCSLHLLDLDMLAGGNPVVGQIDDHATAPFIGEVRARLDSDGRPVIGFSEGSFAWIDPSTMSMDLVIATYDPLFKTLADETVPGINPVAFDLTRQPLGGWELLAVSGTPQALAGHSFMGFDLVRTVSSAGLWGVPEMLVGGAYQLAGPGAVQYNVPFACTLAPDLQHFYYAHCSGLFADPMLMGEASVQLWSGPVPVQEPGVPLLRLHALQTGSTSWLLGVEAPDVDFAVMTGPLHEPAGPLVLRETQ
jgi:hypothetical protein